MWRILTGIGRGLRSVRPSQWCPQDCSDEAPNYYHFCNDEVSKVHAATLQHYTTASSWSPLTVTRYDKLDKQVVLGVTQPKAIHTRSHDNGGPWVTGSSNIYCHTACPPWHWHALQDNKVARQCCAEEEEDRKEEQDSEDWGDTWHYQEWKEILQHSSTLQTIGLGSAGALTLCLYRGWNEHCPCPYHARKKQHQSHKGANKQHNSNNNYAAEEEEKNEEQLWSNCRTLNNFFNSPEASSEAPDRNYNDVTYQIPSTVIYKADKKPSEDAEGLTVPVYSLKKKSLDLFTSFINVQGNLENKNKIENLYEYEGPFDEESELPFPPQRDKPDANVRTDSGCMSDLQDFHSLTTTDSGTEDQYSESGESNTNRTLSPLDAARNVPAESELQADVKDVKSEHSKVSSAQNKPDNSCADDTKMKDLQDRLLEVVKAYREDKLQEIFEKGGKTLSDTKPEEAVVYFQAGVMVGDPSATYNLALCYYRGYGIRQDFEKARKLYEAAAAAGHGWAIYNLAVMVSQGLGGPRDPQRVHSLLQQAVKMGVTEAAEALSRLEMEEQEQSIACEAEPLLRRSYSEPSLRPSLSNQLSYSYSTDDLQSLLDEDEWTDSDLSTEVICQYN